MDKRLIRESILNIRDNLKIEDKKLMDTKIKDLLINKQYYKEATGIFIYVGFGSEIETTAIIEKILRDKKRVFIPRTNIKEKTMDAVEILSLDNLEKNIYGIYEPRIGLKAISKEEIDLVILPGVAFDKQGGRIGYGGGYYDKYLSKIHSNVLKVALAYDFQIIDKIPLESHDILADRIITN